MTVKGGAGCPGLSRNLAERNALTSCLSISARRGWLQTAHVFTGEAPTFAVKDARFCEGVQRLVSGHLERLRIEPTNFCVFRCFARRALVFIGEGAHTLSLSIFGGVVSIFGQCPQPRTLIVAL